MHNRFRHCLALLTSFATKRQGVALIEFAFVLPIFLLLLAGAVDLTRFVLANQKVDRAASAMADFAGQLATPEDYPYASINQAFNDMLTPFDASESGYILTGVTLNGTNEPEVVWQRTQGTVDASKVGSGEGQPANIGDLELRKNEVVIAAEVFYEHSSVIVNSANVSLFGKGLNFDGERLYKSAFYIRRQADEPVEGDATDITTEPRCCGKYCLPEEPRWRDAMLNVCLCTGLIRCETKDPVLNEFLETNGCPLNPCAGGDGPEFCDLPKNQDTCRCHVGKPDEADYCADGGV